MLQAQTISTAKETTKEPITEISNPNPNCCKRPPRTSVIAIKQHATPPTNTANSSTAKITRDAFKSKFRISASCSIIPRTRTKYKEIPSKETLRRLTSYGVMV